MGRRSSGGVRVRACPDMQDLLSPEVVAHVAARDVDGGELLGEQAAEARVGRGWGESEAKVGIGVRVLGQARDVCAC